MGSKRLRCKARRDLRVQPAAILNHRLPFGVCGVRGGFDIIKDRRHAGVGPSENRLPLVSRFGSEHVLKYFVLLGKSRAIMLAAIGLRINRQAL